MRWCTWMLMGLMVCGLAGCGGGDSPVPEDATTTPPEIDTGTLVEEPAEATGTQDPAAPVDPSSEAPPFDPGSEAPAFDPGTGGEPKQDTTDSDPSDPAPTDNSSTPPGELSTAALAARLGDPAARDAAVAVIQQRGSDAVPQLLAALEAGDWQVRAGAVFALSLLGGEARDALPTLRSMADREKHESVRDAVAWAIDSIEQN